VKDNKFVAGVVNGWVLSGISQFQSGAPIQPNTNGYLNTTWPGTISNSSLLGTDAEPLLPALICDPRKNLGNNQFFNPACFAPPAPGKNGDTIWPYIKGPAFFSSDLAIYKDFNFKEHQKVELRFSAFNFLNHPLWTFGAGGNGDLNLNFSNPNACTGLACLMQTNQNAITNGSPSFKTGRRVVKFAAKYNF